MRRIKWMKPISMVLTVAMAFSVAAFSPAKPSSAKKVSPKEETGSDVGDLSLLLKKNDEMIIDNPGENDKTIIRRLKLADKDTLLMNEATHFQAKSGVSCKYQLHDINQDDLNELFITFTKKEKKKKVTYLQIAAWDDVTNTAKWVKDFKNVISVKKNPKKKQIAIAVKSGTYGKNYTTYKYNSSKYSLKKVSSASFSVSGKKKNKLTYKKGSKKITKKAFNKLVKSYNKLTDIKLKKTPMESNEVYDSSSVGYYSKYAVRKTVPVPVGTEDYVFISKPKEGEMQLNDYFGFFTTQNYDIDSEIGAQSTTRLIFGPNVIDTSNPDAMTYQEEDFRAAIEEYAGLGDMLYGDTIDETTAKVIRDDSEDEDGNPIVCYQVSTGNYTVDYDFYKEGELKDRLSRVVATVGKSELPNDIYNFEYSVPGKENEEVEDEFAELYDPNVLLMAMGFVDGSPNRVVNINDKAEDAALQAYFPSPIQMNYRVECIPYTDSGKFYTLSKSGEEVTIVDKTKASSYAYNYYPDFNPEDPDGGFKDAYFENGLFWEPIGDTSKTTASKEKGTAAVNKSTAQKKTVKEDGATDEDAIRYELLGILNDNEIDYSNMDDDFKLFIDKRKRVPQEDRMILYAQDRGMKKYCIIDSDGDYVKEALYLKGKTVTLATENEDCQSPKLSSSVKNFKQAKKVGKNVVIKSYKSKKTTYTTFKLSKNKFKKSTTYSVKGKTYKKGSKKISKKTFNKFLKKYNKSKALKFTEVPGYELPYLESSDMLYASKNELSSYLQTEDGTKNNVLMYDPDAEDKYLVYTDEIGSIYRTILGPDVSNGHGSTYAADDFAVCANRMINPVEFSDVFYADAIADDEAPVEFCKSEGDMEIYDQETGKSANTTVYEVTFGDLKQNITVFSDGPYAGKISSVELWASIGCILKRADYYYGDDAMSKYPEDGMYETGTPEECRGDVGDTRTVVIGGEHQYSVTTGAYVCLVLGDEVMSGDFTGTFEDGSIETYDPTSDASVLKFADALNPANEDGTYKDPNFINLNWNAVKD